MVSLNIDQLHLDLYLAIRKKGTCGAFLQAGISPLAVKSLIIQQQQKNLFKLDIYKKQVLETKKQYGNRNGFQELNEKTLAEKVCLANISNQIKSTPGAGRDRGTAAPGARATRRTWRPAAGPAPGPSGATRSATGRDREGTNKSA